MVIRVDSFHSSWLLHSTPMLRLLRIIWFHGLVGMIRVRPVVYKVGVLVVMQVEKVMGSYNGMIRMGNHDAMGSMPTTVASLVRNANMVMPTKGVQLVAGCIRSKISTRRLRKRFVIGVMEWQRRRKGKAAKAVPDYLPMKMMVV